MKAVKFVFSGIWSASLTYGKIYDVLDYRKNSFDISVITIKNDFGDDAEYFMMCENNVWFEDATSYIREERLTKLGI